MGCDLGSFIIQVENKIRQCKEYKKAITTDDNNRVTQIVFQNIKGDGCCEDLNFTRKVIEYVDDTSEVISSIQYYDKNGVLIERIDLQYDEDGKLIKQIKL